VAVTVAFGAAVALAVARPLPALLPLCLFGALVLFAEHRAVTLPSGMLVTPGFMVGMASIVVFRHDAALLGPLLVGLVSACYLPHVRRRSWGWVAFNAGVVGLATLAAAAAYSTVPRNVVEHFPLAFLAVPAPALAFVVVEWSLLTASYVLDHTRRIRDVWGELGPLTVQVASFGVLGLFLGRLYLDLGAATVVLFVVPIVVARETFATYTRARESYEATLDMLVRTLERKDRYTAGHAERVARYARYIGEEFGFSAARLERLRYSALMHDIGKLAVPNHLLNKPGPLTRPEFERVRLHESVSFEMLSRIDFLRAVAPCARSEDTRFRPDDPDRPIDPYVIAVADAYDAMTSTRAYRRALPQSVAFEELRAKAGTQFHPACVEALIRSLHRRSEVHGPGREAARVEWPDAPVSGVGSAGLGDLLHLGGGA
jgi:HD domain-containing protein